MFAKWLEASDDFELVVPAVLNLACFRHKNGDEFNRRLLEHLNGSGALCLTHTRLGGRYTLRLCVGQTHTESGHVEQAWARIRDTALKLAEEQ
jgi:aromatic-L-amino-acid decarboxylase